MAWDLDEIPIANCDVGNHGGTQTQTWMFFFMENPMKNG